MKRCAECGNEVKGRVYIANGRIYCAEHDPNWEVEDASPAFKWAAYGFIALMLVVAVALAVHTT